MAKKTEKADKTPDAYMVLENGWPLRNYDSKEEAMQYVASRMTSGGDLPTFQVVPVEQVNPPK